MTGSGSGAPGRGDRAAPAFERAAISQLAIILAAGLVFRLIIAYLLPGSGFANDLAAFTAWAQNLAAEGPFGFYERPFFHDYTPGYLYVLWLVGLVGQALGGIGDLIKLPAILADLGIAWLVHSMVLELGGSRRRALLGAGIVIVNPITWFDSVVWGQVDSFGVLFLLLSVRELWRGRTERAAILAVVAALIKPQLGILAPLVAAVTIRRALVADGGWGDEAPPEPTGIAWERRTRGPIRILTTGLAGFLTAVAISSPFGLWVVAPGTDGALLDSPLLRQIFSTAAGYPYLTVNAYNLWALMEVGGNGLALNGMWVYDAPIGTDPFGAILGVPAVVIGSVALLAVIVGTSLLVARRPDRLTILVGLSVLALAFFAVPTRVHERYSFPFFAVAAVLAAISVRWRVAYVVASVATFANMYVVLTTLYDNPQIDDWLGIGPLIRSTTGVAVVAVLHTLALLWAMAQLRDGARHRLADELVDASFTDEAIVEDEDDLPLPREPRAEPPDADLPAARDRAPAPVAAVGAMLVGGAAGAASPDPGAAAVQHADPPAAGAPARLVPAWFDRPSWGLLGPLAWLRAKVTETPIRPDRTRDLGREGRGRFDRLDVWILIVLVLASLFLRTFRLAEPARMHFDEVYHARTAAEFLQGWRYDIDHSIYEWTHPHLAKYAMAVGLVVFPGHDVEASSELGTSVRDAAIEPRRPAATGGGDEGERLWVATGSALGAYDLTTRRLIGTWSIPGATAVAVDTSAGTPQLYVGTDTGEILGLDLGEVELLRNAQPEVSVVPFPVASLGEEIRRLAPYEGGQTLAALLPGDTVAAVDLATGTEAGREVLPGAADMIAAGRGDALVATLDDVTDPEAVASELAVILGGDAEAYAAQLRDPDRLEVVLDAAIGGAREALDTAIADGRLPGIRVDQQPRLAVAAADEIAFLSPTAAPIDAVDVPGAQGLTMVSGVSDGTQLWATTADPETGEPTLTIVAVTGDGAEGGPSRQATMPMPGAGTRMLFDAAAELVHVLGTTPDGTATTVYVVEPHGRSVFADHRLPFVPAAWALDTNAQYPVEDRGAILAFAADGSAASLDVGHYAFAWRMPGVIAGALTVAVLFLLARLLFARRAVAVFVGLFVVLDGMFFVQSRIAMNDVYVGLFILAAYLGFAWLWLDPPRSRRAFWLVMPVVGVLLGLALASKWVAAYAIGALGILFLARSALGRVLLVLGMIGLTAVLGYMAMSVPADNPDARGNLLFVVIMVALTLATVVLAVFRPVAWSREERWFAIVAPPVLGLLAAAGMAVLGIAFEPLPVGESVPWIAVAVGLALLGPVAAVAFLVAGRIGFGPLAAPPVADDALEAPAPAPAGWLRLGSGLGLPAVWLAVSLVAIPLVVYVGLYLPWAALSDHQLWEGFPEGHTGQTLLELTRQMYNYHNDLTAGHAASSPWWAWPANLKPVWFYQGSFAHGTAAAIYDAGSLVIWWMGIPALVFAAIAAYRRRSLALALIVIAFLAQWIAWARIDRASFQYHYYTSLPFVVLALGYLAAEVWHGASRRTWLFVRAAAAVAVMGPALLWLLRAPLCAFVNVEAANPGSQACSGGIAGLSGFGLTAPAAASAVVLVITGVVLVVLIAALARPRRDGAPRGWRDLVPIAITIAVGLVLLLLARLIPADENLLALPVLVPEVIAIVVGIPLAAVALQVATARDARRFVGGLLVAAVAWFAFLYPNIAALPLPSTFSGIYQIILPTYPYAFQFPVNQIPRGETSFADPQFVLFVGALLVATLAVAYSAWVWRTTLAERAAAGERPEREGGPAEGRAPG